MKEKRGIVNQQNAGLFLFVASLLAFIGPHSRMYVVMRYIRLCIISLLATLPLAVHASPQPLEQIKQSESQLSGRVAVYHYLRYRYKRYCSADCGSHEIET